MQYAILYCFILLSGKKLWNQYVNSNSLLPPGACMCAHKGTHKRFGQHFFLSSGILAVTLFVACSRMSMIHNFFLCMLRCSYNGATG